MVLPAEEDIVVTLTFLLKYATVSVSKSVSNIWCMVCGHEKETIIMACTNRCLVGTTALKLISKGDYSVWAHKVNEEDRKDKFCHRPRLGSTLIDVLLLRMKPLSHISPK